MATPFETEALFTAIGLESILDGRAGFHKYQLLAAAKLDDDIRKRMLRFLASDSFTEATEVPDFDYEHVASHLAEQPDDMGAITLDAEQSAALFAAVPDPELAQDMAIQANKILTWATPLVPREPKGGVMGLQVDEPDGGTLADFRRVWQVAADPMTVLADLEDGSLSDDQVAALSMLYPAIYQEMRQAVQDALSAIAARRGKGWEPSPRKAQLIETLRQADTADLELAAAVQEVYAAPAQGAAPPPKPRRKSGKSDELAAALTPGEKAAAGG